MNTNLKISSVNSNAKFFYVILFSITLTMLYNYFFKISNFSNQINNFILISIVTSLTFMFIFKRKNMSLNKLYRITLFVFLVFLIIYLILGTRTKLKFEINSIHTLILLFGFFIIMYIIYTFVSANL